MANASKEDIEHIDADDPRNKWPRTAQAAKALSVSKAMLENMVRKGELRYVYDESNERLFNPADLEKANGIVSDGAEDNDVTITALTILRSTNKDLARGYSDLLRLAIDPVKFIIEAYQTETKALREALETARAKYTASIESFEQALTDSHNRELERVKTVGHEERMNKALEKGLEQLPAIMAGISGKKTLTSFYDSLSIDQKEILFDMLTPEQVAKLSKVFSPQTNGASSPKGAEQTETKPGDSVS